MPDRHRKLERNLESGSDRIFDGTHHAYRVFNEGSVQWNERNYLLVPEVIECIVEVDQISLDRVIIEAVYREVTP